MLQRCYCRYHRAVLVLIRWVQIKAVQTKAVLDQGDSDQGDTDQGGTDQGDTDQGITPVQPNILLVITDDQGLDASAQYSFSTDLPNTPVIDSLAQAGITYENVWATPSCSTTRAALLTGRHGVETGVLSVPGNLPAEFGTIQAYLSDNEVSSDYQTAVFGKWHVDGNGGNLNHPNDFGVDHYAGHLRPNITDYFNCCLLYTSPSPRDGLLSRMPSSA